MHPENVTVIVMAMTLIVLSLYDESNFVCSTTRECDMGRTQYGVDEEKNCVYSRTPTEDQQVIRGQGDL